MLRHFRSRRSQAVPARPKQRSQPPRRSESVRRKGNRNRSDNKAKWRPDAIVPQGVGGKRPMSAQQESDLGGSRDRSVDTEWGQLLMEFPEGMTQEEID